MSYTPEDAEREEGESRMIAAVLEDHRDLIVSAFIEERLASYYNHHPDLADSAERALSEAHRLLTSSPTAALVFAYASVEIGLQDLLLKPVVAGLVHNADMSDLLAALIDIRSSQTEKLLFAILHDIGLPNLRDHPLPSGRGPVWAAKKALQDLRNRVVHRGELVKSEEAVSALELANYIVKELYPQVRTYFTTPQTGWT